MSAFDSIAQAQRLARRRLPAPVYDAILAGSERGQTYADNVAAFDEIGWAPRVADLPSRRNQAVSVLGHRLSLPVVLSPTGVQAVHPDGELAAARAAAAVGTVFGLSSFASRPVEQVVAEQPQTFFQVHWDGTRTHLAHRLERARQAGAVGLVVTLDWSFSHRRDRGSPSIPERVDLPAMARFAPAVLQRPRWLGRWIRTATLPDLTVPNMTGPDGPCPEGVVPTFFQAYRYWQELPPPTWDDLAWLVREWQGTLLLKGVVRPDDARRAIDAGVSAISVSNHGGNNLDSTPASIRFLPGVVEAAAGQVDVLLDGGIRRGADVVKALCLGADAVLIGRPYLWGLAVDGQAGVERVLQILSDGIDRTLLALGHADVAELSRSDLVLPDDFLRRPAAGSAVRV